MDGLVHFFQEGSRRRARGTSFSRSFRWVLLVFSQVGVLQGSKYPLLQIHFFCSGYEGDPLPKKGTVLTRFPKNAPNTQPLFQWAFLGKPRKGLPWQIPIPFLEGGQLIPTEKKEGRVLGGSGGTVQTLVQTPTKTFGWPLRPLNFEALRPMEMSISPLRTQLPGP